MMIKIASLVAIAVGVSSTAQAATLNPMSGVIFTRSGNAGFHKATTPEEISPGDTVMASADSRAQIVLNDGSVITVEPGQVVTVPEPGSSEISPSYALLGVGAAAGVGVGVYFVTQKKNPVSP